MAKDEIFLTSQVLDSGIQIPSPPALLNELSAALDEPDVNLKKVTAILSRDGGVVAMLFKLAGSPVYGGRKAPDSIEEVINLLGLGTVGDLVKGMLLRAAFAPETPFLAWFWERADEVARLAAMLASKLRRTARIPPGHAQLAAMFMDCGVPMLIKRFPDYVNGFHGANTGLAYQWPKLKRLDADFATNHAVVGALMARHWKLPAYVCEAIQLHHEGPVSDERVGKLLALIQAATHLYSLHALGEDPGWQEVRAEALARLELNDHELEDLREEF